MTTSPAILRGSATTPTSTSRAPVWARALVATSLARLKLPISRHVHPAPAGQPGSAGRTELSDGLG
ncbi:hypothetical protein ACRAWD_18930 [Caulobacter segnis]